MRQPTGIARSAYEDLTQVFATLAAWSLSFRTQQDTTGGRWQIADCRDSVRLRSPTREIELLHIHHAIGAIHWMPPVHAFSPNLLYIDGIHGLLARQ